MFMLGAGVSTAAGIPDFRTPGSGLYDNLAKYNLPSPESVFSLEYLREHPETFYRVATEMRLWPGGHPPTHVHHFIRLLAEDGRLLKCCTQNIDGLERAAGLRSDDILEAHGTFSTSACINCHKAVSTSEVRRIAESGEVPRCDDCGGIVKPDVVFFGESLPKSFHDFYENEAREADLLIIIGTSLTVYPFAGLADRVGPNVPRVVIDMVRVGTSSFRFPGDRQGPRGVAETLTMLLRGVKLGAGSAKPRRDILLLGNCQEAIQRLAEKIGLGERLRVAYEVKMREHKPLI